MMHKGRLSRRPAASLPAASLPALAEALKALGHPVRLRLVEVLAAGECTVGELARRLPLAQALVSQQLKTLRAAGLVAARREANRRIYHLANPHLPQMLACLGACGRDLLGAGSGRRPNKEE